MTRYTIDHQKLNDNDDDDDDSQRTGLTTVCSVFAISSRWLPRIIRLSASEMTVLRYWRRSSSYPMRSHRELRWYLTRTTHTHTTILRPFFLDHPGQPVPEENFRTLWCKELTKVDTPTIWPGATPSGLTSANLHHPPHIFFTSRMPFLPPNWQRQSTEGN